MLLSSSGASLKEREREHSVSSRRLSSPFIRMTQEDTDSWSIGSLVPLSEQWTVEAEKRGFAFWSLGFPLLPPAVAVPLNPIPIPDRSESRLPLTFQHSVLPFSASLPSKCVFQSSRSENFIICKASSVKTDRIHWLGSRLLYKDFLIKFLRHLRQLKKLLTAMWQVTQ